MTVDHCIPIAFNETAAKFGKIRSFQDNAEAANVVRRKGTFSVITRQSLPPKMFNVETDVKVIEGG